eukprot:3282945-Pyramimonas_sp.AAC.1
MGCMSRGGGSRRLDMLAATPSSVGSSAVELDSASRVTSVEPGVERRRPALSSYDIGQTVPSMSQEWMIQTDARRPPLP